MKKNVTLLTVLLFTILSMLTAGTTGKIVGTVTDARSGEPLPGVNIILVGTSYGAVTDFEGRYLILNLQPGTYTIRASSIGYAPLNYSNVQVKSDLTTTQDFKMSEETVVGDEVIITAERPLVQRDLTSTTSVVGGDDIKQLPVTEIGQVIGLQAGNVAGSIRGGRKGETAYWIDGVPVTDAFNGSAVVDVNPSMVQELQVLSGAFNAEYGQAMSGIVNIVTKEGAEKYSGNITAYGGDFLSNHTDVFKGIQKFEPFNIRNIEGSFSGPLIGKDVSMYLNARNIYYGGYLNGIRKYTPSTAIVPINVNGADIPYVLGTNSMIDRLVAASFVTPVSANLNSNPPFTQRMADSINAMKYDSAYSVFSSNYTNPLGDGKTVSMNWNQKLYFQAKLAIRLSSELKLNITGIFDDKEEQPYNRDNQYVPDAQGRDYTKSYTTLFQLTHTLSGTTFYTLSGSYFDKNFKHYLYENPYDPRYTHPDLSDLGRRLSSIGGTTRTFNTGGSDLGYYHRATRTALLKFDMSSQVTNQHFVKGGLEYRQHRLFLDDIRLRPTVQTFQVGESSPFIKTKIEDVNSRFHDTYLRKPTEFSGYLQDKMEFKDLIVNIGVRADYFEPDADVLTDLEDPNILDPFKDENKAKTLDQRRTYWYKKAAAKYQLSPRFGASFPITDRGVIHFSYGHFFQIPNFERLYSNPGFKLSDFANGGNLDYNGAPMGNADLKPEQTINGEIGLQQQLTDDMSIDFTVYMRDIRNLTGTRADQIIIGGGQTTIGTYSRYINSDFGFVRGFIISLDKRFGEGLSMGLDYTFQIAKGSASSPDQARNQYQNGERPETQLIALDWDQRHTLNGTFSYTQQTWGGSLIAQFGSGTPYTPPIATDPESNSNVSVFMTNTGIKPFFFNSDMRLYKSVQMDALKMTLFLRVNNLFDIMNETGVYGDTGRAGETKDQRDEIDRNPKQYINTVTDYFTNATFYSEPRRIEFGTTIEF
jgi:outer membrane receptor protein involved in Fe transport